MDDSGFDVFLSYNSQDKPAALELADSLKNRELEVWLDIRELRPGSIAQESLEEGIKASKAGAVLIGKDGIGPWENQEMRALLDLAVRENKRVIPVLLPEAPSKPELPPFLSIRVWVDLRGGLTDEGVDELVYGIIGKKPSDRPPAPVAPAGAIAVSKLPAGAEVLVGRDGELQWLDDAWAEDSGTHVASIVAWGGVGKTALANEWMNGFVERNWEGVEAYFDWSFYSQGTRDQSAASADVFIAAALGYFGDPDPKVGSPYDRGVRLARLVAGRRSLLILDGLEPLQHGPGPMAGELKDPALEGLLKGLAQLPFKGLCVLTSREAVVDLNSFHRTTVDERNLEHLSEQAGAELLHRAGANRAGTASIGPDDTELVTAAREVDGHALTLQLLGRYLALAHEGDVRRRDRVEFEEADKETQNGHAFRVIGAYERWLRDEGKERLVALLYLLGLFDRPADMGCLDALRQAPVIAGLTEPLVDLPEADWNITLKRLAELGLISYESPGPVDAHPLVREYFAKQLSEDNSEAWRAAHRRLYEHLCETTDHRPDTIEGLQPLYQAVAHGCQAGLHQQACDDVYHDRIQRKEEAYSTTKLGAIGADLGAVACFFDEPWSRFSPNLERADRAWLLNQAAVRLRALGRLSEALQPMRAGLEMLIDDEDWERAAATASNLSELELTLGDVAAAVRDGEQSVTLADRSGEASERMIDLTVHADALHQAGRREEALRLFGKAEAMQAELQPGYPRLYSLRGFLYCELLLADAERAAWRGFLGLEGAGVAGGQGKQSFPQRRSQTGVWEREEGRGEVETCDEVAERAKQTLGWATTRGFLLDIGLDHLTLGRAAWYGALLGGAAGRPVPPAASHLDDAVDGLRASGQMQLLPLGLLTRAWSRCWQGDVAGSRDDLDEAWEIAERGSMKLHQADVQLTRARLFRDHKALDRAAELIQKHGYYRRDEELADAQESLGDDPND